MVSAIKIHASLHHKLSAATPTVYIEYNSSRHRLNIFTKALSADLSNSELDVIIQREEEILRKKVLDKHAEHSPTTQDVIDGNTTFYQVGEPIIKRSRELEEAYQDRNFGHISKKDILHGYKGNQAPFDSTKLLLDEDIINPRAYFGGKVILPKSISRFCNKAPGPLVYGGFLLMGAIPGYMLLSHPPVPGDDSILRLFSSVLPSIPFIGASSFANPLVKIITPAFEAS